MPGKIVTLPEAVIHKIAAGEVIERPASIVKELLENAIDAGATDIRIALSRGGCGMIRITDNGEGLTPEDLPRAFYRHATSKIHAFEDIYRVSSFGFRGEALPSIAAVARVEMTTRTRGAPGGRRIVAAGGQIGAVTDAGCPEGTTVTVTQIFDAVPVRKKFLKTENTEQGYCMDVITRTALAHPDIRVQVFSNDRVTLTIPATQDASERVALILGMDVMDHLQPVQAAEDRIRLQGFISVPPFSRSQGKHLHCFVNRRYVRDPLLHSAIMTAYRRSMEPRRYPACVLMLDLPPADVDVNVHPAKMEVRFHRPREIYGILAETLFRALARQLPASTPDRYPEAAADFGGSADYRVRVESALKRYRLSPPGGKRLFPEAAGKRDSESLPLAGHYAGGEAAADAAGTGAPFEYGKLEYLGQAAGTYLVFCAPEQIILVDQHAAHERVLFEALKSRDEHRIGQRLLIPEVLSLSPRDRAFMEQSMDILEAAGIEAELFGGDAVIIRSIPAVCSHVDARAMIMDMIESLTDGDRLLTFSDRREKILRLMACAAAVKANQPISPEEAAALCRALDETPFAATCPHGRPVHVILGLAELEKRFHRK